MEEKNTTQNDIEKKEKVTLGKKVKAKVCGAAFGAKLKIKSIPTKIQTRMYGH